MQIEIDSYEAVNLLSALRAIRGRAGEQGCPFNPLKVLNSGEWAELLETKLTSALQLFPDHYPHRQVEFHSAKYGIMYPQCTPEEYITRVIRYVDMTAR